MDIEKLSIYKKNLILLMHYYISKDNVSKGYSSDARFDQIDMPLNEELIRKLEEVTTGKPRGQELSKLILYTQLNQPLGFYKDFHKGILNLYLPLSIYSAVKAITKIKINKFSKYILLPLAIDECGSIVYLVLPIRHNLPVKCYAFDIGVNPEVYCAFENDEFLDLVLCEIRDWHEIPLRVLDFLKAGNDSKFFTEVCFWEGSSHATIISDDDESCELSDDLKVFKEHSS